MTLQPIGPRLLIRPDDPIKKIGSIALPDKAQKNVTRGVVVAVGELWEEPIVRHVEVFDGRVLAEVDSSEGEEWSVGDTCRLGSGGPEMTITGVESKGLECMWFDRYRIPIEVGSRVVFADYTGIEVKEGEEKLLLLTLKDVYAIEERA